jgi:hypothetical protein
VDRAEDLRLRADLAKALQRRNDLQDRWGVARHTSSGTDRLEDLDVELADAEATIAELEKRLVEAGAPALAASVAAPANDTALAAPEYLDTKAAAEMLGISRRTLEGLRARGQGPAHIRIGRRVLYALATLRTSAK